MTVPIALKRCAQELSLLIFSPHPQKAELWIIILKGLRFVCIMFLLTISSHLKNTGKTKIYVFIY